MAYAAATSLPARLGLAASSVGGLATSLLPKREAVDGQATFRGHAEAQRRGRARALRLHQRGYKLSEAAPPGAALRRLRGYVCGGACSHINYACRCSVSRNARGVSRLALVRRASGVAPAACPGCVALTSAGTVPHQVRVAGDAMIMSQPRCAVEGDQLDTPSLQLYFE